MSRSQKRRRKEEIESLRREMATSPRDQVLRGANPLDRAARLIDRGNLREAQELLEGFERTRPGHQDALRMLLEVYYEQQDYRSYCRTTEKVLEQEPDDRGLHLALADAYQLQGRGASALLAFRRFVERWPDDPDVRQVRVRIRELESLLEKILRDVPFPPAERFQLAALHEDVLASIADGDDARTVRVGEQLRAGCPDYIPTMNNLSHAYFNLSRTDDALAMSQRVLNKEPDNFHALANLSRFLLLGGRADEAGPWLERLRSVRSENPEVWCKKAETFSFFGEDADVLQVFEEARREGWTKHMPRDVAYLCHLAGVAAARQGDYDRARQHWQEALRAYPRLELAQENLADAALAASERHGPWPYSVNYWICEDVIKSLSAAVQRDSAARDDSLVLRRFCREHPEVVSLVPALLDRGDEPARRFALQIAKTLDTPAMHEALRNFCLSQRGPDIMRMETANRLIRIDVLPAAGVRMWCAGEWHDVELTDFEVTNEPTAANYSSPEVQAWAERAVAALHRGDGGKAEELLKQCLEIEGDRPELLNNLAMAYQIQERKDEYRQLARQIHERWPDYFFGRVAMAKMATRAGDYEQAIEYLAPLRRHRRLHTTEYSALCAAYIELFIVRGKIDAAKSWLGMWKRTDPDHRDIERFERMLKFGGALESVLEMSGGQI